LIYRRYEELYRWGFGRTLENAVGAERQPAEGPQRSERRSSFEEPPAVDIRRLYGSVSVRQCIHAAACRGRIGVRGWPQGGTIRRGFDHCTAAHRGAVRALGWAQAERHRRKPLLLVGLAALPIRAVLFALTSNPFALMVIQLLDGITGAVLGVMTALVIADVTKGTGRFNLAQGVFGTMIGIGASLSTTVSGLIVYHFGRSAGFVSLAAEALVALVTLAIFLPETKEEFSR